MNCPNCNKPLTCGCQKRSAANGKVCCSSCISSCNAAAGAPNSPLSPRRASVTPKGPYTPHT